MTSPSTLAASDSFWRVLLVRMATPLLPLPAALYVNLQVLDAQARELALVLLVGVPIAYLLMGVLVPALVVRAGLRWADAAGPQARVTRLLKLPALLAFVEYPLSWLLATACLNGFAALSLPRPPSVVLVGLALGLASAACSMPILHMLYEGVLRPLLLADFQRHPSSRPVSRGLLLPRQSWFLPALVLSVLLVAFSMSIIAVDRKLDRHLGALAGSLHAQGEVGAAARVLAARGPLGREVLFPVTLLAGWVGLVAVVTAGWAARRQREAAEAVHASLAALVEGRAAPPRWVSTDEVGDLAAGTWQLYQSLQQLPATLHTSAEHLAQAGGRLTDAIQSQNGTLGRQAEVLQGTRATAQEIQQSAQLTARHIEGVRALAQHAAALGSTGEGAVSATEEGLARIRAIVEGIQRHVRELSAQAEEVSQVTELVKELADQSQVLAINASIEAVRAGEQGVGFNVVAKEMRALARQSLSATDKVREMLGRMKGATDEASQMVSHGAQQMEHAVGQLRSSGHSLRELTALAQETSTAVKEIAGVVELQHQGVGELFAAVQELGGLMDETLRHLGTTDQASTAFAQATGQVLHLARRYTGTG